MEYRSWACVLVADIFIQSVTYEKKEEKEKEEKWICELQLAAFGQAKEWDDFFLHKMSRSGETSMKSGKKIIIA